MKKFTQTGLWAMLGNPKSANNGFDADAVLNEFVEELQCYCREEKNIAERTRSLWFARYELNPHHERLRNGPKKNVPLRDALNGAIGYIDCELTLVEMDLEYPQRFLDFPPDIQPLARWAGNINDLIEYSIAPQVSGRLLKPSGERMTYADDIKLIELIFGIIVSGAYDRKTKIFGRQNNTKFQDEMRQVLLEEAKKNK